MYPTNEGQVNVYLLDSRAQLLAPIALVRLLGDEAGIGARGDTGHQSQPATMPAHDFNDEGARMRARRGLDVVHHLTDAREARVAANGGIGTRKVVVDGPDQADNVEVLVR